MWYYTYWCKLFKYYILSRKTVFKYGFFANGALFVLDSFLRSARGNAKNVSFHNELINQSLSGKLTAPRQSLHVKRLPK